MNRKTVELLRLSDNELTAEGSAALVVWRILQLLVFWRCRGEDAGDHQDSGFVGVSRMVDHDGRQDHAEQRQRSHGEDDANHDVSDYKDEVHDDGKAGLAVDGFVRLGHPVKDANVADALTLALLLFLAALT